MLPAQVGTLDAPAPKPKSFVIYAAEQQTVTAGKRSVLEFHFRVVDGYHVNSHTPKSELLIPTQMNLQPQLASRLRRSSIRPARRTASASTQRRSSMSTLARSP